jgi:hypothetical protein
MSAPAIHKIYCGLQPASARYKARKMIEAGIDENDVVEIYYGVKMIRTALLYHLARDHISFDILTKETSDYETTQKGF